LAAHKQINNDKGRQGTDEKLGGSDPAQRQEANKQSTYIYIPTEVGKYERKTARKKETEEGLKETQFSNRGSRQPRKTG
jgi:hypothetical protein